MSKEPINKIEKIENALNKIYQSPEPSAEFLNTLEKRLEKKHPAANRPVRRTLRSPRWAATSAMLATVMTLFVFIVGPQRVLAQVQAMIGYVPGVGFVDVNDVRVLVSPVSQTQGDITVTVKQVMAGPNQTYLVLSVDGLEPTPQLLEDYWEQPPEQPIDEWLARYRSLWESDGRLILPDGSEVYGESYQGSPGDGFYTMPTLPAGVHSAVFAVTRLPGVPADKAPQGWTFALEFGYAAAPVSAPVVDNSDYTADSPPPAAAHTAPSITLPEASPVDTTSETVQGISLRALEVVYAETETTIRLAIENIPPDWHYRQISLYGILTDDLGNEYTSLFGPVTGLQPDGTYLLSFDPISPQASLLTLTVDQFSTALLLDDKTISVDFGDAPQVGDTIPLDEDVQIFGTTLHFNSIYIREGTPYSSPENTSTITWLDFMLDPIQAEGDRVISGLMLTERASEALGIPENAVAGGGGGGGGGGGEDAEHTYYFYPSIGIPSDVPLPTGSYEIPIDEVQINILGPFVIDWEVPAK